MSAANEIHPQAKHKAHPLAGVLPMMDKPEIEGLKEQMQKHGFREDQAIVLLDGLVLDGRNRYVAALESNTAPQFRTFDAKLDGSPAEYVLGMNYHRRHLSASQRAAVAASMLPHLQQEAKERGAKARATSAPQMQAPAPAAPENDSPEDVQAGLNLVKKPDEDDDTASVPEPQPLSSAEAAAEKFGTSKTMVTLANKLQKKAPDLYEQVLAGSITVNKASADLAQREADKASAGTKEKERTERRQAIETIEGKYGKENKITVAAKGKKVCKAHDDLLIFAGLAEVEGKKIFPLLVKGWTVARAQKFLGGKATMDSSLGDLVNFAILAGKGPEDETPFTIDLGGWRFEVSKINAE